MDSVTEKQANNKKFGIWNSYDRTQQIISAL